MTTIERLAALDATPHANVFPEGEPMTIRLQLAAGERVDPHRHPDRQIVFSLLEGTIDLELGDETHTVEGGEVAQFDGDQDISPVARTDSTALIVLATKHGSDA